MTSNADGQIERADANLVKTNKGNSIPQLCEQLIAGSLSNPNSRLGLEDVQQEFFNFIG